MPKVLLLTGDAAEDLEVMYPYQRLLEEGSAFWPARRFDWDADAALRERE